MLLLLGILVGLTFAGETALNLILLVANLDEDLQDYDLAEVGFFNMSDYEFWRNMTHVPKLPLARLIYYSSKFYNSVLGIIIRTFWLILDFSMSVVMSQGHWMNNTFFWSIGTLVGIHFIWLVASFLVHSDINDFVMKKLGVTTKKLDERIPYDVSQMLFNANSKTTDFGKVAILYHKNIDLERSFDKILYKLYNTKYFDLARAELNSLKITSDYQNSIAYLDQVFRDTEFVKQLSNDELEPSESERQAMQMMQKHLKVLFYCNNKIKEKLNDFLSQAEQDGALMQDVQHLTQNAKADYYTQLGKD